MMLHHLHGLPDATVSSLWFMFTLDLSEKLKKVWTI